MPGLYLGRTQDDEVVTTAGEQAVRVLGPPRFGETSSVIIAAVPSAAGPVATAWKGLTGCAVPH